MKKRILTVLLAVCLVVALGTVTAAAADEVKEIPVAGGALSGDYKLTADTTVNSQLTVAADETVTIDLNGFTLSYNAQFQPVIINKGSLTIDDTSSDTKGRVVGEYGVKISDNAVLTLKSGTIEGQKGDYGAVYFKGDGTLVMNGGTIATSNTYYSSISGDNSTVKNASISILGGTTGKITLTNGFNVVIGQTNSDHSQIHVGTITTGWGFKGANVNLYSGIVEKLPTDSNIIYNNKAIV